LRSVLPAALLARTAKVCWPPFTFTVSGESQPLNFSPSSEHLKCAPLTFALKAKRA
jgi:hypothetical protein